MTDFSLCLFITIFKIIIILSILKVLSKEIKIMSYPELNDLTKAEQLFDDGKLDEALEVLKDWSQFKGLTPKQQSYYQFLYGLILFHQNKYEEIFKFGELIFKEGQKLNDNLQMFDGYFFIA